MCKKKRWSTSPLERWRSPFFCQLQVSLDLQLATIDSLRDPLHILKLERSFSRTIKDCPNLLLVSFFYRAKNSNSPQKLYQFRHMSRVYKIEARPWRTSQPGHEPFYVSLQSSWLNNHNCNENLGPARDFLCMCLISTATWSWEWQKSHVGYEVFYRCSNS